MKVAPKYLPYLALFIGTFCIGWSAIFVKLAAIDGVVSAFYRVGIALLVLVPVWIVKIGKLPPVKILLLNLVGGCLFGLDLTFWNVSILHSTAATSTVLANFAPIWVALGAVFLFQEKLSLRFWIGTLAAISGILMIIGWQEVSSFSLSKGNAYALIASVFYAAYLLTTQQVRKQLDTLTFMTFATLGSCLTLFVAAQYKGVSLAIPNSSTWSALIGLGLLSHVLGWYTINYSLGYIKSAIASVSLLSQAVWTAFLGIFILHELPQLHQWIGGAVVLFGVYWVNNTTSTKK
jgi:drug/metabolite transporter (DMT)-like permease